jgi:hypothetical protein
MANTGKHLSRLVPAANAAAILAAVFHVLGVAVASGSIGIELLYVATLTYLITILVALPVGCALLLLVGYLRLGLLASLLVFLVVIQVVAALTITFLFESDLADLPMQYALVSVPATVAAWYFSAWRSLDVVGSWHLPLYPQRLSNL